MSGLISIDLHEVYQLADDIETNAAKVPAKSRLVTAKWGYDVEADAHVLVPKDTRNLDNSISTDITDDGLGFEVGPTAEYGDYVEQGTHGPYPIENAFGWGITVMHPGEPAQPYMGPAFDRRVESGVAAFGELAAQILGHA